MAILPIDTLTSTAAMNPILLHAILICTLASIIAEALALVFPERILALFTAGPDTAVTEPLLRVLAPLSVVYLVNIGLLTFSGDTVFVIQAGILLVAALLFWALKKWLLRSQYPLMVESAVCLAVLLNVAWNALHMAGYFSV